MNAIRRLMVITSMAIAPVAAQSRNLLTADGNRFMFNGQPLQIISGEMHYTRIPREYWRDRLLKARGMGLNTVSTYVFWNAHERARGRYDFSGQNDIAAFVRIAGEVGLHVIVRPGPYVCAEWELGGYPAWLFADSGTVLRSLDPRFTAPAARWLDRLGRELTPLLSTRGGPIIAVQVENEYGSFDRDKQYLSWQRDALVHAGFKNVFLYTADGDVQLPMGTLSDVPAVVNFGTGEADSAFARLARFRPGAPLMSGEYWAGWFDHWGRRHSASDSAQQRRELTWMLTRGYSVNLYLFHGGTTFGFMNGANIDGGRYWPQVTSYDYDAALDESGRPTPKYFAFRDLIMNLTHESLPAVPTTPPAIELPPFPLQRVASLWATLPRSVRAIQPVSMESLGQSTGYTLYRTIIRGGGLMRIPSVRDYAQVFVNGVPRGVLDRRFAIDTLRIGAVPGARLDILVENLGRVNFAKPLLQERKGIVAGVMLDGQRLDNWEMFTLPMDQAPIATGDTLPVGPAFYRGTFNVVRTGDTFLDTRGWGKGAVWVNGHALGRFWQIGPQQTLYVPGVWLKSGRNDIVVFDQFTPIQRTMRGVSKPVLDELQ